MKRRRENNMGEVMGGLMATAIIPDILSELGRLGYNVEVLGTN